MSRRSRRLLWALIAAGTAIRIVVAFTTVGVAVDIDNYGRVVHALRAHGLHAYAFIGPIGGTYVWPYPPGFFPFAALASALDGPLHLPFHGLVQLPAIAADAAIACLVQAFLGRRGASDRVRLVAAGAVALGPSFAYVSGYHGQMDSLAVLPVVAAIYLWELDRRALAAGALVGLAAAVKSPMILALPALLVTARSRRELVELAVPAIALPVAVTLPFLVAEPHAVVRALEYRGLAGQGGLSLLVQPGHAEAWIRTKDFRLTGAERWLHDHAALVNVLWLVPVLVLLAVRRPRASVGVAVVWLGWFCFATGFAIWYLVWAIPFFLMAGRLREVVALQLLVLVPTFLIYGSPWSFAGATALYAVPMLAAWLGFLLALIRWVTARPASTTIARSAV